eukprot:TRINITY_DN1154_c0_g3_i1.p1 TRINITY_DN1154_c0_g3~~TRINITY_DN1154_c0_g3_i1.p1  ORF type:complete len:890 (+),score=254.17 TRINITY_DN1154_c0_g3_i1:370-3039(+)
MMKIKKAKKFFGRSTRLKAFIEAVRECSTAQEERELVAKECADIRTAFRNNDEKYRHRNMMKLLYVHMLGYPSHFGQKECFKLITKDDYCLKRVGYLGLTMLVNEKSELLIMATNSIKNDFQSNDPLICGLALDAFTDISSEDMCAALAPEVLKLVKSRASFVRKKACSALTRIIRKLPEFITDVIPAARSLLGSNSHGVLLAACSLILAVLKQEPKHAQNFQSSIMKSINILRDLLLSHPMEYTINGVSDPYLMCSCLRVLRNITKAAEEEKITAYIDILTQISSAVDGNNVAGSAVLYEAVMCILDLPKDVTDAGLRVIAVNILGRFLAHKENNMRCVALISLNKMVKVDLQSVQRHQATIVNCLKDSDPTIRKKAVDLVYSLVNNSNVRTLARELLNYMVICEKSEKMELATKIHECLVLHAPSPQWRVTTLITMLSINGCKVPSYVLSALLSEISNCAQVHSQVVHRLFQSLKDGIYEDSLVMVALWSIGEFGQLLLVDCQSPTSDGGSVFKAKREDEVIDLIDECFSHHGASTDIKGMCLNTLAKLSVRFASKNTISKIEKLLLKHNTSLDVELQQRSVEYSSLMNSSFQTIRRKTFKKMPTLDMPEGLETPSLHPVGPVTAEENDDIFAVVEGKSEPNKPTELASVPTATEEEIDDIFGVSSSPAKKERPVSEPSMVPTETTTTTTEEPIDDIFGGGPAVTVSAPASETNVVEKANETAVDDIFGGGESSNEVFNSSLTTSPVSESTAPSVPTTTSTIATHEPVTVDVWEHEGVRIEFHCSKDSSDPANSTINASFINDTDENIENFVMMVAVPKNYLEKNMDPASGEVLEAMNEFEPVTQVVKLRNMQQGKKPIRMRLRLTFVRNGKEEVHNVSFDKLPKEF